MPLSFPGFVAALRDLMPEEATSLAIAIAGVVDPDTGRITAANLPAVNRRALAADLGAALGRPVWIGNDADCFVLTEALLGVGRGHRSVFGIILGSGVGGGIVLDGRLLTGAGGIAGEWGHAPVLDQRPLGRDLPHLPCGCGQSGCVDTYGSARGSSGCISPYVGKGSTAARSWRPGGQGRWLRPRRWRSGSSWWRGRLRCWSMSSARRWSPWAGPFERRRPRGGAGSRRPSPASAARVRDAAAAGLPSRARAGRGRAGGASGLGLSPALRQAARSTCGS